MGEGKGIDLMQEAVHTTEIPLHWVEDEGTRLDASFYTQDSIEARILFDELEANNLRIETIGDLTKEVDHRSRFKRDYADEDQGEPYVTPTDMFMFPLEPRKYIANPPDGLKAEPGWILLTCSGTVGRSLIANQYLSECILTHDLIRVIPNSDGIRGYLYAFINSWVGQALLTKDEYGATVKHIEPHHVESIPIPRIPDLETEMNNLVTRMQANREEAERLMREVKSDIHRLLELPEVDEFHSGFSDTGEQNSARVFMATSDRLRNRIDAPYYKPIIQQATDALEESPCDIAKVGDMITRMFIPSRFKRPYVDDPSDGIPFMSGSHLVQIKPLDLKYLWEDMDGIEDVLLEEGWVLMSRSGTVGRMRIVDEFISDCAASEHVLRLVPEKTVNPGYLMAFLNSDYGQIQIDGKVYGAVVDEIAENDTSLIEDIDIPQPSEEIQTEIGDKVMNAYELIGEANELEQRAIAKFESELENKRNES